MHIEGFVVQTVEFRVNLEFRLLGVRGPLQRTTENREQDTSLYRISSFAFHRLSFGSVHCKAICPTLKVFL